MHLPRELRDKIYRLSLCSFSEQPTEFKLSNLRDRQRVRHSSNISLLCVNRQIHLEAYDIMVKTNCFLRIELGSGIPNMLRLPVPVVCTNEVAIDRFKGYAASIRLNVGEFGNSTEIALRWPPESYMLLARDLDMFCQALSDVDFYREGVTRNLEMAITIGPYEQSPPADFYTDKIQQYLLQPFRKQLRALKGVTIQGRVSPELATVTRSETLADAASPEKILEDLMDGKDTGARHYRERKFREALTIWLDAASEVEKIHKSSSWATIVTRGGPTFLTALSEAFYLTKLNIVHLILQQFTAPSDFFTGSILAEDALYMALQAMRRDFWSDGYKWSPSPVQLTKLRYRWAMFLRVRGDPDDKQAALRRINGALRSAPDDVLVLREKELIIRWIDQDQ
ncbi:hypothetical protein DM02DRAFT_605897 [Periconia macrospinosa]|uniref:Uncharacterized protein n=1 Tax=Periconia macrospinosa TaxID=97972 RepID=A0A2V1D1Y8_9PLEO|nr:hypothetical protein DM02DRAFT_605897 [Periconia macrospinosa]